MTYLLFAGENYHPRGGVLDYKGTFSTLKEAHTEAKEDFWMSLGTWAHVAVIEEDGTLRLVSVRCTVKRSWRKPYSGE